MAIIHQGSKCAICAGPLNRAEGFFATSGVFFPKGDPLWRYCDAPMHWRCYGAWGERKRFANGYFQSWVEQEATSLYWWKAYLDEALFVSVNPDPSVAEIHLHLATWGTRDFIKLKDWAAWLANDTAMKDARHEGIPNEWKFLLPILKEKFPTADAVIAAVDWTLKRRRIEELEKREKISKDFAQKKTDDYNQKVAALADRMKRDGLVCPKCSRKGSDFRVMEGVKGRHSYLVCIGCGGSAYPEDFPS